MLSTKQRVCIEKNDFPNPVMKTRIRKKFNDGIEDIRLIVNSLGKDFLDSSGRHGYNEFEVALAMQDLLSVCEHAMYVGDDDDWMLETLTDGERQKVALRIFNEAFDYEPKDPYEKGAKPPIQYFRDFTEFEEVRRKHLKFYNQRT